MLIAIDEAKKLIEEGKVLHIAGDEKLLNSLPEGSWIGGTTPYFITNSGGVLTKDKVFVNVIDGIEDFKIKTYSKETISSITSDCFDNGYTLLILPFGSDVLTTYSAKAPEIDNLFLNNIVGWVSGFDLSAAGQSAKTFANNNSYGDLAAAMHLKLSDEKMAQIGIINIFSPAEESATMQFDNTSMEIKDCTINGEKVNFASYLRDNNIDTKLPFMANYSGNYVNISIKAVESDVVHLYAPVFPGMEYKFAKVVPNYADEFVSNLKDRQSANPVFSCNCILNYLYGELEGKATAPFEGPVTFGEIAYQLVNQTLVYINIL